MTHAIGQQVSLTLPAPDGRTVPATIVRHVSDTRAVVAWQYPAGDFRSVALGPQETEIEIVTGAAAGGQGVLVGVAPSSLAPPEDGARLVYRDGVATWEVPAPAAAAQADGAPLEVRSGTVTAAAATAPARVYVAAGATLIWPSTLGPLRAGEVVVEGTLEIVQPDGGGAYGATLAGEPGVQGYSAGGAGGAGTSGPGGDGGEAAVLGLSRAAPTDTASGPDSGSGGGGGGDGVNPGGDGGGTGATVLVAARTCVVAAGGVLRARGRAGLPGGGGNAGGGGGGGGPVLQIVAAAIKVEGTVESVGGAGGAGAGRGLPGVEGARGAVQRFEI